MMKLSTAGSILLALAGTLFPPPASAAADRIVAIGDIHGAYDPLVSILRRAGLIDGENRWIGRAATLVQTGDFLDRGARAREVMDLLMSLQEQAVEHGGRAIVLLGNHEILNLTGHLAEVAPEAFAAFADARSEKRRQKAYGEYARWARRQAELLAAAGLTTESEADWLGRHPPGRLEYQEALGPQGRYGRWLRSLPTVVRLGDTLFVHGGLAPELAESDEDSIHRRVGEELEYFDRCRAILVADGVMAPSSRSVEISKLSTARLLRLRDQVAKLQQHGSTRDSPLEQRYRLRHRRIYECVAADGDRLLDGLRGPHFFRGHAKSGDDEGLADLTSVLRGWSAERLVVGHTPTRGGRIRERFDGRVLFIDTGMLSTVYLGGRASALEIVGSRLRALYADGSEGLLPDPGTDGGEETRELE